MKLFVALVLILMSFYKNTDAHAGSCVFCRPEIMEEQFVYESVYFKVIVDNEPRVRGHLLIVPKRHVAKAHELFKEEWEEFSAVLSKVVQFFSNFLNTDQYIIIEKNGRNAFQQISHVHFHLFPIQHQTWAEIFDQVPNTLSEEELKKEISIFRDYFELEEEITVLENFKEFCYFNCLYLKEG